MKKRLITILLLVGCIPLLLSSFYFYQFMKSKVMVENDRASFEVVKAAQVDVRTYLQSHMQLIKILGQNPYIVNMDGLNGTPLLVNAAKSYPEVSVVVSDRLGMQKFRGDNQGFTSVVQRQFFQDAVQGKDAISDVLISQTINKPIIVLATPLRSDGNVTGIIQGTVQLAILDEFLKAKADDIRQLFIIDRTGKVLAHSDPKIGAEHKDISSLSFVQVGLEKGGSGIAQITDDKGKQVIIHYSREELTGWLICSEISQEAIVAPVNELRTMFSIVLFVLILVLCPVGYFVANGIVSPIKAIVEYSKQVAAGNLRQIELNYSSKDEIGELAASFAVMVTNLRELIQNITQYAEQLAASAEELTATTLQSAQAINHVAGFVGEVAEGAEKQVEAVTYVTAAVEQVSVNIHLISNNAHQVTHMSAQAAEVAQNGNIVIGQAVQQMAYIERTVASSAEVVMELGERSQEIGQIVDTIATIAGQTNLLALNAAIEAARAGEQGRGFAVVAEEVRKLAEQSQAAAGQIAELIKTIQNETGKAVVAMKAGSQEVKKGEEVVDTAGQKFYEIATRVNEVLKQVGEISSSMGNITTGVDQVVATVRDIGTIGKEAASHTQTVSAATEEQSASLEEIAASSQELAKMAQQLRENIGKFKLI